MSRLELITVPYNSAGRPGGVTAGPNALRAAGLTATLRRHADLTDHGDVDLLQDVDATRGPAGMIAEASLAHMVDAVRDRTTTALEARRTVQP